MGSRARHLTSAIVLFTICSFNAFLPDTPSPFLHDEEEWAAAAAFMDAAPDTALTVLNGNLWMLPGPLAVDKSERLARFVALAQRLRPHVITVQEVWTKAWVDSLAQALPAYTTFASGRDDGFNTGGLVTLTRLPGEAVSFTAFAMREAASTIERKARKGYLTVRIVTPTRSLALINTHLYAPTKPAERSIAAEQFEVLRQQQTDVPAIIIGDLNIPHADFVGLNNGYFTTESDTSATCDPGNPYARLGVNAHRPAHRAKLDRLVVPGLWAEQFSIASRLLRTPLVSDHYLMGYRLSWSSARSMSFAE